MYGSSAALLNIPNICFDTDSQIFVNTHLFCDYKLCYCNDISNLKSCGSWNNLAMKM